MAETIPDEELPSMSLPRKNAASETQQPAESFRPALTSAPSSIVRRTGRAEIQGTCFVAPQAWEQMSLRSVLFRSREARQIRPPLIEEIKRQMKWRKLPRL